LILKYDNLLSTFAFTCKLRRYILVRLMTAEEVHPELWKGANRKFKTVPWQKKAAEKHDRWGMNV